MNLRSAAASGGIYGLAVFGAGFVAGTLRVLFVAPRFGATLAVAFEAPIMLAASWWICARVTTRLHVPREAAPRVVMGATGFATLMVCEAALGVVGFGRAAEDWLADFATAPGALGLAAQTAFALIPFAQGRRASSAAR